MMMMIWWCWQQPSLRLKFKACKSDMNTPISSHRICIFKSMKILQSPVFRTFFSEASSSTKVPAEGKEWRPRYVPQDRIDSHEFSVQTCSKKEKKYIYTYYIYLLLQPQWHQWVAGWILGSVMFSCSHVIQIKCGLRVFLVKIWERKLLLSLERIIVESCKAKGSG